MELKYFLGLLSACFFLSCAGPQLTNSHRGNYKSETLKKPERIIEVSVSALPIPPPKKEVAEKPKTFFDLRDSIPIKFLEVIGEKAGSIKEIIDVLKEDLSKVEKKSKAIQPSNIDESTFKLRLLLSNIKKYYNDEDFLHPDTRLEFLNTTIKIETPGVFIQSIDRLENEMEEIDLGTLERTQNVEFNSKISGEYGSTAGKENIVLFSDDNNGSTTSEEIQNAYDEYGNLLGTIKVGEGRISNVSNSSENKKSESLDKGVKAELAYANVENIKENLAIKFKKMKTGFSFTPTSLTVSQRGRPLSDISDNIIITLTLKRDNLGLLMDTKRVTKFTNLFDENGKINKIDDIIITDYYRHYSPCAYSTDIILKHSYEGAIRGVQNLIRGRNILEYDDKVVFHKFSIIDIEDHVKIEKSETCNNVYKIVATFDGERYPYTLHMDTAVRPTEVLIYEEDNILDFRKWLYEVLTRKNVKLLASDTHKMVFINNENDNKRIALSGESIDDNLQNLSALKELTFIIR